MIQLTPEQQQKIDRKCVELDISIQLRRHDLLEAWINKEKGSILFAIAREISDMKIELCLLKSGRFEELPYSIKILFI